MNLNVGHQEESDRWEIIVKFAGNLDGVRTEFPGIEIWELLSGYAVMIVPESIIDRLAMRPEISFIEKPKRLFFAVNQGKEASCITGVQSGMNALSGVGTLVAVIDTGIDYTHPDFRNPDGSSRILWLWDQVLDREFSKEEIDKALSQSTPQESRALIPSVDLSGHGTAVAGIAAGNGRASGGRYKGVAYESQLIVVKLGNPLTDSFPRTTQLMRGVDYAIKKAISAGRPVAINLSFGMNYGSHTGDSLLETFLEEISGVGQNVIVVGTGNEGASSIHTTVSLPAGEIGKTADIQFTIGVSESFFNVQVWKSFEDRMALELLHPSGEIVGQLRQSSDVQRFRFGGTEILAYYGEPSPYSVKQEIYLDFIARDTYLDSGIWIIRLLPEKIINGRVNLWLPSSSVQNIGTGFLNPVPELTQTIPSTARKVLSVGAYDSYRQIYADFSGRGANDDQNIKPDIAAPGVGIMAPSPGGGYTAVTGTSFATPFVTGSCALMMEWGIVKQNDIFLYGEKIKAYLTGGAKPILGAPQVPNSLIGYGALCLADSFPR